MRRTLRAVLVTTLGGWSLIVLAGGSALAKPTPSVSLTYERSDNAADCPDAGTVRDAVRARLGFDPFREPAAINIRASVARSGDELRAAILVSEGTTQAGERHLVSNRSDCSELASAISLALSIAIDPLRVALEPPPPRAQGQVAAVTSRSPVPEGAPAPPPKIIHASLGTAGNVGGSLSPALGFFAGAGIGTKVWSVAIQGGADLPSTREVQGGRISVSTLSGTLVPCLHRGPLGACALATVAVMRGSAEDLDHPRQVSTPVVALGARTMVEVPSAATLCFRAHLDLLSPLVRTTLRVGGEPVWTSPPVSVALGLSAVVKFR